MASIFACLILLLTLDATLNLSRISVWENQFMSGTSILSLMDNGVTHVMLLTPGGVERQQNEVQ